MKARDFLAEDDQLYAETAEMVWGIGKHTARGGETKLKFRCTTGPRKSRQVSHPSKCAEHPKTAQAQRMKTTRARTGPTQARRQKRTKSINTASVKAASLNKQGASATPKPWY